MTNNFVQQPNLYVGKTHATWRNVLAQWSNQLSSDDPQKAKVEKIVKWLAEQINFEHKVQHDN